MNRILTFESFVNSINEKLNRKDLKEVQDLGYDAELSGGTINVNGENPWGDEHNYTFYWDGEAVWCESDAPSGADYNGTVTTPEEFADAMIDTDNWD